MFSISIIYEDKDFLVVNKPAGLLVHPTDKIGKEETIVDWLVKNYPSIKKVGDNPKLRPGIVHRLDKDTSGILLITKNQNAFDFFKENFKKGGIKKTYLAVVYGKLNGRGIIKKPIGLVSGTTRRSTSSKKTKMVKEAVTEYKAIKSFIKKGKDLTLVELYPKTGRTHQLRVHLASIHHPIVGDRLYGLKKNVLEAPRQLLHAKSLEFTTPRGERIKVEAEPPPDFKNFTK